MKIPKIIHQTWETTDIPPEFREYVASWKKFHPDWKYMLWTEEMRRGFIKKSFPWFLEHYDRYPKNMQRADAFRYFLLYEIGGLYVDLDFECLKSMDGLIGDSETCLLGLEPDLHCQIWKKEKIICNAWMASPPKHEFFKEVFQNLIKYADLDVLNSTGPFMLTKMYDSSQCNNIQLFSSKVLYPLTSLDLHNLQLGLTTKIIEKNLANAYAVHYFASTRSPAPADKYFTIGTKNLKPIFITLGLPISEYLRIFPKIGSGEADLHLLNSAQHWLEKVHSINRAKRIYLDPGFSRLWAELWFTVCFQSHHLGIISWKLFWQSPLSRTNRISLRQKLKFAFLSLTKSSKKSFRTD
ncbi:MAG: glycosyltransferase family 32 protein [Candidatus Hodarchaeota archaeon]